MQEKREIWVDNVKVFACILVVVGHFFQSMAKGSLISESALYLWFIKTIYLFHVPLFFVCSGYLYQKYSKVNSVDTWKKNISNKLLDLGIPYLTFTIITWVLKKIFETSVNDEIGGLLEAIFLRPIAPYWYLYCLFFLFVFIPTFKSKKMAMVGLLVAMTLKMYNMFGGTIGIYLFSSIFANMIWFVIGINLNAINFEYLPKNIKCTRRGAELSAIFVVLSIVVYMENIKFVGSEFLLGIVACSAVILLFVGIFKKSTRNPWWVAKYTMPIFLMHTIFAAGLRSLLIKIGIMNVYIHIILGVGISFVGPIIAAYMMGQMGWINFLLYPRKTCKMIFGSNAKKRNGL